MNLDFLNVEMLVVEPDPAGDWYTVVGITYGNALAVDARYKTVRASMLAIDEAKAALAAGKIVRVPAKLEGPEARPSDLIVTEAGDELEVAKRVAVNEMNSALHQNALGASVMDMFGFMTAFARLADCGVFVTDENRDEKYFEVIDSAQQAEQPAELPDGASYADEQAYLEKKRKYAFEQSKLEALEKYLVAYDRIKGMYAFDRKITGMISEVEGAASLEAVSEIRQRFLAEADKKFSLTA